MELTEALLGFVLLSVGATATALAASYWRVNGPTLLSFGVFGLLYGSRLMLGAELLAPVITLTSQELRSTIWILGYWTPVPAIIYCARIREGSGRWLDRLWQGWIVLAIVFTLYDRMVGTPGSASDVYQYAIIVLVVVLIVQVVGWTSPPTLERRIRRIGAGVFFVCILHDSLRGVGAVSWSVSLEQIGIATFILTLGFATVRQFFSTQRELAMLEYEMKTARSIQKSILPRTVPVMDGLEVAVRYLPMGSVAGDMYEFHLIDAHQVGLLVADVTGHGVPAALIASMAKVAFTSQVQSGNPGEVLGGMNRALSGQVESRFLTATYVEIDTRRLVVRYSSAGHPPPLLWRRATGAVVELEGQGVLMGFDPEASYSTFETKIDHGDRLLLYTDGIIETTNLNGRFFGNEELQSFMAREGELSPGPFLDALLAHLRQWSRRGTVDTPFEDDLTMVVADVR